MKKKLLIALSLVVCMVALVVGSVAGTLAFLRDRAVVVNTFTYGSVGITMDETALDKVTGQVIPNATRVGGNSYLIMPGTTYIKDPVIHITPGSQDMYLFLKVDNGIAGLALTEDEQTEEKLTIQQQLLANGWKIYVDNRDSKNITYSATTRTPTQAGIDRISTSTVYYYVGVGDQAVANGKTVNSTGNYNVTGGTLPAGDVPTLTQFHITGNTTQSAMGIYDHNACTITITAFACQASGVPTIQDAADKFAGEFDSAIPVANPS